MYVCVRTLATTPDKKWSGKVYDIATDAYRDHTLNGQLPEKQRSLITAPRGERKHKNRREERKIQRQEEKRRE